MNLDLVRKKLGKLYVDGHITTKDFCDLADALEELDRKFIRCQYRIDERVFELLRKEVA
jgi:hypothetical protein